jgi:hypothetical protein
MNNYDFLNLGSTEFERLVRDLLQAERNVIIESFPEGVDGGIDLRYTTGNGKLVIIQCKRYKSFSQLKAKLDTEVPKVVKLKPDNYILATSASLTAGNKGHILTAFRGYIKSTDDILGKDDLNNLLTLHPSILLNHYKLYISGTAVLQKIINSKIYHQSRFEEAAIKKLSSIFVENESMNEALRLLSEHNVVLLSGQPGVGKTTLAYMLVYYLLGQGFDRFVYLSEDIADAYAAYDEGAKTIFLFDDFLGTNFLKNSLDKNEDNRLIKFISGIQESKTDLLILTTREYILNQAQLEFGRLKDPVLQISRYTLDLGKYTYTIKAQMFANHLSYYNIPLEYLDELMREDAYIKIVYHKNFNPRIIELIIDKGKWEKHAQEDFSELITKAFDNPEGIWLDIYESEISVFSRCALAILATFDSTIYLKDFKLAIKNFVQITGKNYQLSFNDFEFNKSIKEILDTFITTSIDERKDVLIEFQNPSIRDFLIYYLSSQDHKELLTDILQTAVSLNQLTSNIESAKTVKKNDNFLKAGIKIGVDEDLIQLIKNKIIYFYNDLKQFHLSSYSTEGNAQLQYYYYQNDEFSKLTLLLNEVLYTDQFGIFHQFIVNKFENLPLDFSNYTSRDSYVILFEKFHTYIQYDENELAYNFGKNLTYLSDWKLFVRLNKYIPKGLLAFKANADLFIERYQLTINNEKARENKEYLQYSIKDLEEIGVGLQIKVKAGVNILKAMVPSKKHSSPLMNLVYQPWAPIEFEPIEGLTERNQVKQIFRNTIDQIKDNLSTE